MGSNNSKRNFGIGSILFGGAVMLMSFDIFPMNKQYLHAPEWIFGICGFAFMASGFAIVFQENRRLVNVITAIVFFVFSFICAWIAFFGGGSGYIFDKIAFLSVETNSFFLRVIFGFNSIFFLVLVYFCLTRKMGRGDNP